MKYLFLVLFVTDGIIHLVTILLNRNLSRWITKIFLLPLLAAYYIIGAERFLITVFLAAVLGWAGDIFLIGMDSKRNFLPGLSCFLLGHLAYIVSLVRLTGDGGAGDFNAGNFNGTVLAISTGTLVLLGFGIFKLIRPSPSMTVPVILYELFLGAMSICALQFMLRLGDIRGISVFAGSLCFLLSDTLLGRITFRKPPRYGHFFVMLFYIAAQGAIIIGLSKC